MSTTLNLEPILLCAALDGLHRAMEQRQTDALMVAVDKANELVNRSKKFLAKLESRMYTIEHELAIKVSVDAEVLADGAISINKTYATHDGDGNKLTKPIVIDGRLLSEEDCDEVEYKAGLEAKAQNEDDEEERIKSREDSYEY